jgi:hypothetical protein
MGFEISYHDSDHYRSRFPTFILKKANGQQWTMDHPFIALFGLTTTVGMFVWLLHKCVARDLSASRRAAYGGEKGEGRLD